MGLKNRIAFYLMPVIKPSRPGIWGQAVCDFWYSENEVIPKSDGLAIQPEVVTNYNVTGSERQAASNKLLDIRSRII